MGVLKLVVFWTSFLLIFAVSKALVTLAVVSCNAEALVEGDECFQFPIFEKPNPIFETDLEFSPQFVWFDDNNTTASQPECAFWDLKCKAVKIVVKVITNTIDTGRAIVYSVINLFRLIAEVVRFQFNVLLEIFNFISSGFGVLGYMIRVGGFIVSLLFTFIPGAPWFINVPFIMPVYIGSILVSLKIVLAVIHGDK